MPDTMKAVVIDGYGDADVLHLSEAAVPELGSGEVLVEVAYAGVGVWDSKERSGAMAAMLPDAVKQFPRVIGGDGSGRIAAVGDDVTDVAIGDEVYGYAYTSPKGGFYADYVVVPADQVAPLPPGVDLVHAAALAIPSGTALRGLADALKIASGDRIAIFGASGSVGLPAVQLAKALGASVLAMVSGQDGAEAAKRAGADVVVDSGSADIAAVVAAFAPGGLDGILATANGRGLEELAGQLRSGGTVAWPNGVQPEPTVAEGRHAKGYNGDIDRALLTKLNGLVGKSYEIALSEQLPLAAAAAAHRLLEQHRTGRPILIVKG